MVPSIVVGAKRLDRTARGLLFHGSDGGDGRRRECINGSVTADDRRSRSHRYTPRLPPPPLPQPLGEGSLPVLPSLLASTANEWGDRAGSLAIRGVICLVGRWRHSPPWT